jgi:penicillin-binding protein 2
MARFAEQFTGTPGVDLEIQSTRVYPHQGTAAHLLGYLRRNNDSIEGEEAFFSYRLPDYRGVLGIEGGYDAQLHGRAGEKSILVNSLGYRQTENIWTPAEPGRNLVLTIDLEIQQATERALRHARVEGVPRGAAVVMDVRTGDVLAMASSPSFDPNQFAQGISAAEYQRIQSLTAEKNRATQENYQPGSIFKPIVALACLEKGLDPEALYEVQPNPREPGRGIIYVGRDKHPFRDQAAPGHYNFKRALIHSSNGYFITAGLKTGIEEIVRLGQRLHLGEKFDLPTGQETRGNFPTWRRIHSNWYDGDTANICIGQGGMDVTPLQMAVFAASLANGGKVLWPRLVDRVESQDLISAEPPVVYPAGVVRDTLGVRPRTLQILKQAMLADTEDPEGTAYDAFRGWPLQRAMRVCGKTGTAQKKDAQNHLETHYTWFLSFAPYENPRYAVVVMVEGGSSGGGTCAPVGREIYEGILAAEQARTPLAVTNAR